MKTKTIALGALLAAIAALFQLIPVFFSEGFVLITIFSVLPIYIIARIQPKAGVVTYVVASLLVMIISVHEGLFFLCTNGIIGVSLGICCYYTKKILSVIFITTTILTITLCIVNYGVGILIFGGKLPGSLLIQVGIIYLFSDIYSTIYYFFARFLFRILKDDFRII